MKRLDDIRNEILKTPEAQIAYEEERMLLIQEIADEERERFALRQSERASVRV
jgi:hypothetical protein